MNLTLGPIRTPPVEALPVEIVERKGRGHPDTICDALVEQLSLSLSRAYFERFGRVLHHNVDKALLVGGASRPAFGGGHVDQPIEIFIAGRAARALGGEDVPVDELAETGSRAWLAHNVRWLDAQRHVRVHPLIRAGSVDLVELFGRRGPVEPALANDSSIGVGYAPLSRLERVVLAVEARLNADLTKERHPEIGEDVKVLGVRRGEAFTLTVAAAFVDRFIASATDYLAGKEVVAAVARDAAREAAGVDVDVAVNTADDPAGGRLYLTVTGTSAEAGDDGQAGRGNRWNGLITPYRPMTLESAPGKNPVSHVGKLYQIAAQRVAEELVAGIGEVREAECWLASRIGHPITEPDVVDVKLRLSDGADPAAFTTAVDEIAAREVGALRLAWRDAVGAPFRSMEPKTWLG
jgi:S-adenosylmethionine synthetase